MATFHFASATAAVASATGILINNLDISNNNSSKTCTMAQLLKAPIMSACSEPTGHTAKLYYIYPYMNNAASGGKLRPWLAKNLLCFFAWIKVANLQDIAVNDEGGKFLQKRSLQY